MRENPLAAGALPRTPLEELDPLAGGDGAGCPSPHIGGFWLTDLGRQEARPEEPSLEAEGQSVGGVLAKNPTTRAFLPRGSCQEPLRASNLGP